MFCDEHGTADFFPDCALEASDKQIEQLKAQVNELLDQLQYIASQYSNCGCGHPACRRCQDQRENDEIIARIEKGLK